MDVEEITHSVCRGTLELARPVPVFHDVGTEIDIYFQKGLRERFR